MTCATRLSQVKFYEDSAELQVGVEQKHNQHDDHIYEREDIAKSLSQLKKLSIVN